MAWPASPPSAPARPAAATGGSRTTDAVPLEEARLELGLTVAALAARAGVSEATIYRIARGATTPRPSIVRRLSAALGRSPGEIAEFRREGAGPTANGGTRGKGSPAGPWAIRWYRPAQTGRAARLPAERSRV